MKEKQKIIRYFEGMNVKSVINIELAGNNLFAKENIYIHVTEDLS